MYKKKYGIFESVDFIRSIAPFPLCGFNTTFCVHWQSHGMVTTSAVQIVTRVLERKIKRSIHYLVLAEKNFIKYFSKIEIGTSNVLEMLNVAFGVSAFSKSISKMVLKEHETCGRNVYSKIVEIGIKTTPNRTCSGVIEMTSKTAKSCQKYHNR